ncbi:hypothetical protein [Photobacterium sp. 1_MG-2023]|uniref:hypothetical protein n=1 Tax=Photobacterium sp. 1_MG-2023 TaxID=3062646 RepID=UPI0026E21BDF|nr:hypothetical protein [Photobacterium sp. 1_MG-2023]MDO6704743.1 hypothetical protein [Photobacterium sp. 1_MG-2023]
MKRIVVFLLVCLGAAASADQKLDYVHAVTTPGQGRLVTVDDYWLLAFSNTYDIRLPEHVTEGQKLQIQVKAEDAWQSEPFTVVAISIYEDLCRLHRQHPSQDGRFPSDAIYIQPCARE